MNFHRCHNVWRYFPCLIFPPPCRSSTRLLITTNCVFISFINKWLHINIRRIIIDDDRRNIYVSEVTDSSYYIGYFLISLCHHMSQGTYWDLLILRNIPHSCCGSSLFLPWRLSFILSSLLLFVLILRSVYLSICVQFPKSGINCTMI